MWCATTVVAKATMPGIVRACQLLDERTAKPKRSQLQLPGKGKGGRGKVKGRGKGKLREVEEGEEPEEPEESEEPEVEQEEVEPKGQKAMVVKKSTAVKTGSDWWAKGGHRDIEY